MLTRPLTALLAVTCGATVANVYMPQAISPDIASGLGVPDAVAASVVSVTQLGYAVGIFFLVPLGDRIQYRGLITILLGVTGAALFVAGLAPIAPVLVGAAAVVGVATCVPQVIVPMAAGLADDDRRSAVVGALMSGLMAGILLARTFSGLLGGWLGWRAPYLVAASVVLVLAVTLRLVLPSTRPSTGDRYGSLLRTSLRLLREHEALRRSCLYQTLLFASFSAAWTSLALLITGPRYGLGTETLGLIALVGLVTAAMTPVAGRWVDRTDFDRVSGACFACALLAAAVLSIGLVGGALGLAALVLGMLLIDASTQCGQVANQSRALGIRPDARSRANTAYMTCSALGAAVGSWLGVQAYQAVGWGGVCGFVAILTAVGAHHHASRLVHVRS
jgi:predicted MFS family arabinose efflux permease